MSCAAPPIVRYAMLVQYLIEQGSELTHKSVDGMDALHVACRSGSVKMAFLLLSAGAYVDSADGGGETPLHWCLKVLTLCHTVLYCTVLYCTPISTTYFISIAAVTSPSTARHFGASSFSKCN